MQGDSGSQQEGAGHVQGPGQAVGTGYTGMNTGCINLLCS